MVQFKCLVNFSMIALISLLVASVILAFFWQSYTLKINLCVKYVYLLNELNWFFVAKNPHFLLKIKQNSYLILFDIFKMIKYLFQIFY